MSPRLLFLWLAALAMLVAPLAMPGGAAAMATAPSPVHHPAGSGGGHCDEPSAPDSDAPRDKAIGHACCGTMCVAVMAADPANDLANLRYPNPNLGPDSSRRGFLGEIATPPPKRS
jgi:hypothetical protein